MTEERIFTGDILTSLDLCMQAELPLNDIILGYPHLASRSILKDLSILSNPPKLSQWSRQVRTWKITPVQ